MAHIPVSYIANSNAAPYKRKSLFSAPATLASRKELRIADPEIDNRQLASARVIVRRNLGLVGKGEHRSTRRHKVTNHAAQLIRSKEAWLRWHHWKGGLCL